MPKKPAPKSKKPTKESGYLLIVESPTKAKTIARFLGKGAHVLSSFGHVRDLPKSKIGVDTEHDFTPSYIIPLKARKIVKELKAAAAKAETVYFASDEDREGEAISWHLEQILDLPKSKTHRITFHEITDHAIKHALEHPRTIDMRLVDAQQARRILDRLVGYELSPFLWRKIARGLSAGRVQSVVVRLIVEREREILAFIPKEYWSIDAELTKQNDSQTFSAKLTKINSTALDKFALPTETDAKNIVTALQGAKWHVESVEQKTSHRSPYAPFTTSTLQQEANNRLGFSSKQTMTLAQQLYEVGFITYMRTDSTNLSDKFLGEAREFIRELYGAPNLSAEPRVFKTKAKNAQEAHEAVRPTNVTATAEVLAAELDPNQKKLYELIWQRAVASQMIDAELSTMSIDVNAATKSGHNHTFHATGSVVKNPGFMTVYPTDTKDTHLPVLTEGDAINPESITPTQHFTEPPPRYTEASLVKTLEENGIGRPSTYAPTIGTVVERGYVEKDARKLKPTELAFKVNDLLVEHFPDVVDYHFTANMEQNLDAIAEGEKDWIPVLKEFYTPFKKNLTMKDKEISKESLSETTNEVCDKCGKPMAVKFGRFGKFLACTGFPDCKNTKQIAQDGSGEIHAAPPTTTDEKCPNCGADMVVKRGRFGEFLSCSRYPDCKTIKSIVKPTGVKCNKCGTGDIAEKRTKAGKIFFACSNYPKCENAMWSKPTGEICPKCSSLLVEAKAGSVKCSNKDCDFTRDAS
jgi:DNA topoisomerase-1